MEVYNVEGVQLPFDDAARDVADKLAQLVVEKNHAYGNSVVNSQKILAILYPNGVPADQYKDVLYVIRVLDKLSRIATDRDAFGESPWKDIYGYSLLAYLNTIREEKPKEQIKANITINKKKQTDEEFKEFMRHLHK